MHAAGIQFDYTFFVGQAAKTHRVVVGIVLGSLDHLDGGIERVASALQKSECGFQVGEAVVGAHDDGALVRTRLGRGLTSAVGSGRGGGRAYSGGNGSEHGRLYEITTREGHERLLMVGSVKNQACSA
jgi:hypothetical protein